MLFRNAIGALLIVGVAMIGWSNLSPMASAELTGNSAQPNQPAVNQTAEAKPANPDEVAIRKSAEQFAADFNRGDAKAVAAYWVADGEYIDELGQKYQGRDAIEAEYANFFKAYPGIKMQVAVDSVNLVNENTLIEDGRSMVMMPSNGSSSKSRYVAVHVKQDGKWSLKSVRDTRIDAGSSQGRLADMEWMIGTWTTEHEGVETSMNYEWKANSNYVLSTYKVTKKGEVISEGSQIIGWDPVQKTVTSKLFGHDGGLANGVWVAIADGWAVNSSNFSIEGVPSAATNLLRRVDDNTLAWHSVNRSINNQPIPDLEEIVLVRSQ